MADKVAVLRIYDTDAIKHLHKDTKSILHSQPEEYSLPYDDGRISVKVRNCLPETLEPHLDSIHDPIGQQVTSYHHGDTNEEWELMPFRRKPDGGWRAGPLVRHKGSIHQLLHEATNLDILADGSESCTVCDRVTVRRGRGVRSSAGQDL